MQTKPSAQEFPRANEAQRSDETLRSISEEMEIAKAKLQLIGEEVRRICREFEGNASAGTADNRPNQLEPPASIHRSGAPAAVELTSFNLGRPPRHGR